MYQGEKISVVIRVRNEEAFIGHTIQSVIENLYKPEIIIVNNNSNDRSIEIIESFMSDPELKSKDPNYTEIKIININQYTPGKAINLAASTAKNNILLVISAHCVLKNINMDKHIKDLDKYCCIFGNQIPVRDGKKINKRYIWSHFTDKVTVNMYSDYEDRYFMHNALAIFNKNFICDNKFDEFIKGKEDRYWAKKIIDSGRSILYDPQLSAFHHYTINGATWVGLG